MPDEKPTGDDDTAPAPQDATAERADDAVNTAADDGLLSRLRLIEERPLVERADAYTRIHAELVETLEGGDERRTDG